MKNDKGGKMSEYIKDDFIERFEYKFVSSEDDEGTPIIDGCYGHEVTDWLRKNLPSVEALGFLDRQKIFKLVEDTLFLDETHTGTMRICGKFKLATDIVAKFGQPAKGLIIKCALCKSPITEQGALLFQPTNDPKLFKKTHICNECDGQSAPVMDKGEVRKAVDKVLRSYQLSNMNVEGEEGTNLPLVDRLSSGNDILTGKMELEYICDDIVSALSASLIMREIKLPEKKEHEVWCTFSKIREYENATCDCGAQKFNQAIDLCQKAINEAR